MKPCPMCKGNGEIADIIFQCVFCRGTGQVTEKSYKILSDLLDSCNDAKKRYVCFDKNRKQR